MGAMADGTRVRLMALLATEELTVAELTQITSLTQSRISTHLAKLRDALVPGGWLMLSTPDAGSGWGRQLKYYRSLAELPVWLKTSWSIIHWLWRRAASVTYGLIASGAFAAVPIVPGARPSFRSIPNRAASASGFARARLISSTSNCSTAVG